MYVITIADRKEEESIEKFLCEHPVLFDTKLRYLGNFFWSCIESRVKRVKVLVSPYYVLVTTKIKNFNLLIWSLEIYKKKRIVSFRTLFTWCILFNHLLFLFLNKFNRKPLRLSFIAWNKDCRGVFVVFFACACNH